MMVSVLNARAVMKYSEQKFDPDVVLSWGFGRRFAWFGLALLVGADLAATILDPSE